MTLESTRLDREPLLFDHSASADAAMCAPGSKGEYGATGMSRSLPGQAPSSRVFDASALAAASLEAVGLGLAVVRPDGQALMSNSAFRHALRPKRRGLIWDDGFFRARRARDMKRLARILMAASRGSRGFLRVEDLGGAGALELVASGLPSAPGRPACASVLVREPATYWPVPETLVELYGLTPAEAGLTVELVRGLGLAEACSNRAITVNTGKGYLKRVFEKTGARRQSELASIILQGVAPFCAPTQADSDNGAISA